MGAIVERRPAVWRRCARWYVGVYRRLKAYANDPEDVPIPRFELSVAFLGTAAIIVVGALANNWNALLWFAFVPVLAIGLPLFWQMIRCPGG